jgi:hypothetical protein
MGGRHGMKLFWSALVVGVQSFRRNSIMEIGTSY